MEKERINRVQKTVPGLAFGRVRCPACGNSIQFVERAESIMVTTFYNQNGDGSFTMVSQNAEIGGELSFLCGECGKDLSALHGHFREMSF